MKFLLSLVNNEGERVEQGEREGRKDASVLFVPVPPPPLSTEGLGKISNTFLEVATKDKMK